MPSTLSTMYLGTPLWQRGLATRGFFIHRRVLATRPALFAKTCSTPVPFSRLAPSTTPAKVPAPPSQLRLHHRPTSSPPSADLPPYHPPRKGVLSRLPPPWVPYMELMRIHQPGGLYGFYFPYLIGLTYAACIASPPLPPTALLSTGTILLVWTVFLRGAACTINDNLDQAYDRKVARCRLRPIARGAVTTTQGHVFYVAQAIMAGGIVSQLPHAGECFQHAVPILTLLSLYPLAKRVTDFPQLVLCVPLAWGILMSCCALGVDPFTTQSTAVAGATACLVASDALWLIMLDYVNACQDTADDVKAGVRSMAVRYRNTGAFIATLGTAQVGLMVATGVLAGLGPVYFTVAVGGNVLVLARMAKTVKRERPEVCAWWFLRGSLLVGGCTVVGFLGEYLWKLGRERASQEETGEGKVKDIVALK